MSSLRQTWTESLFTEQAAHRERKPSASPGKICGEVEDVVSALTPVGRGVAQVFHELLVELRLLLVAEEEEGREEDRQEESWEVESGVDQREERTPTWMAMKMVVSGVRTRRELEPM